MKTTLAIAIVALLSGCALNRPFITEKVTTTGKDGTVTTTERTLKVTTLAAWPASTEVTKQTANAGKTLSTGAAGIHEDGGGTNVVETLRALDSILGKVRP